MNIRRKRCTARGNMVDPERAPESAPTADKLSDGQLADHYVLCPEDRAKGYVEPYRESYIHVGIAGPRFPLVDLSEEQHDLVGGDFVKYEPYPESEHPALGRYWSQADLDKVGKGCRQVTRMPRGCAETYAAQPSYYGSTFCCGCGGYFPVGRSGEFIWNDDSGQRVGTTVDRRGG